MDAVMRALSDPAEAFAQYGWYLAGAAVLFFWVIRPYVDGEIARRRLAEANDPSRRRTLDEKRAAVIADRQAKLDKDVKDRPPPKPKPKPKPKPRAPIASSGGGPMMGHRGGGSSYQRPNPRSRRPGGGGGG
jgi:hypothetical protein